MVKHSILLGNYYDKYEESNYHWWLWPEQPTDHFSASSYSKIDRVESISLLYFSSSTPFLPYPHDLGFCCSPSTKLASNSSIFLNATFSSCGSPVTEQLHSPEFFTPSPLEQFLHLSRGADSGSPHWPFLGYLFTFSITQYLLWYVPELNPRTSLFL